MAPSTKKSMVDLKPEPEPASPEKPSPDKKSEGLPVLANVVPLADGVGHRSMLDLTEQIVRDGLIRCVNGSLFVVTNGANLPTARMLPDPDALFAFLQTSYKVLWHKRPVLDEEAWMFLDPVSRNEIFAQLPFVVDSYQSIEELPHAPKLKESFYLDRTLAPSTGVHLDKIVEMFNPESEADRDVFKAALVTQFWGGGCGTRPAFLVTSGHGRGSGKTTTANTILRIAGDPLRIDEADSWPSICKAIINDSSPSRRGILMDNVKKRLSFPGLEALITAPKIGGHRMYLGHRERLNYFTVFITSNAAQLSEDLVQRCVILEVGPQKHSFDFGSWFEEYLNSNREAIVSDIMAFLQGPDLSVISPAKANRWLRWQQGVLAKFPNANTMIDHIYSRQRKWQGKGFKLAAVTRLISSQD